MTEKRPASASDTPLRFTGNLSAYRREFASDSRADTGHAVASPAQRLSRRYDAKKTRATSRVSHPLQENASNRSTRARSGSHAARRRKAVAAAIGFLLVGAALGRHWEMSWEMSEERLPSAEPDRGRSSTTAGQRPTPSGGAGPSSPATDPRASATVAVAEQGTGDLATASLAIASLKERIVESDRLADRLRGEIDLLRNENGLLGDTNSALSDETTKLNRELLDLEVTMLALQNERESDLNAGSRVVYNFVDVPIGSDPYTGDRPAPDSQGSDSQGSGSQGAGSQGAGSRKTKSTYDNSIDFAAIRSESIERSGSLRSGSLKERPQQLADGSSDESLDEIIQGMIRKRRN